MTKPKYPRGHKVVRLPGTLRCAECGDTVEVYVIDHKAHLRHKP